MDLEDQSDNGPDTLTTDTAAGDLAKWKAMSRKHEDAEKKALADLAAATTRNAALETELQQAKDASTQDRAKALRYEVAAEKGLPLTSVANLVGATRDELAASADGLLETVKALAGATPPAPPQPPVQSDAAASMAEAAQSFFGGALR